MESIHLIIQSDAGPIEPTELAEFLYLFRGANVALQQVVPSSEKEKKEEPNPGQVEDLKRKIAAMSPLQIDSFFDPTKGKGLLEISTISRQNPLEIVVLGCVVLVTCAAVFSGGAVEIGPKGIKAKLPPLGTGIKALREALGLDKRIKVRFGIRTIKVKLNEAEYKELKVQVSGQGGFQNLFRQLQDRVNDHTKELTLNADELERIAKHQAEYKKGGFQARLKKIFGRHLPDPK